MDLVTIARLGSLLRATITDYTALHEKRSQIVALKDELCNATSDTHQAISKKYLAVIESYLITKSMLDIQYQNLQSFAGNIGDKTAAHHREITQAQLELMILDMEYMQALPSFRDAVRKINEILTDSGIVRDEMLTMVGVVKDGEIRV